MSVADRFVRAVTQQGRLVVALALVVTLVMGAGVGSLEQSSSLDQFETDGEAAEKLEYIQDNYGEDDDTTTVQIVVRGENVLDRESLLATLELQQEFQEDDRIEPTLTDEPFTDVASIVAMTAMQGEGAADGRQDASAEGGENGDGADAEDGDADVEDGDADDTEGDDEPATGTAQMDGGEEPSLEDQIEQLESMSDEEVEDVVAAVLGEDADRQVLAFLPTDYEQGSTQADARMLFVTQHGEGQGGMEGEAADHVVDSQLAMAELVDDRFGDGGFVFGAGIITDEIDRSLTDSLIIVVPMALLFVSAVLAVAYRDLLDIVLGLGGVALVLVWTVGFLGWAGIDFNQLMIAVPVLLVGLSVDYAIHLFMRHREARDSTDGRIAERRAATRGRRESREDGSESTRSAMTLVVAGLGVAFVWVTATAVIGFLSNLVSPIGPIREFGIASAFGIVSALVVFGAVVPAAKVELDALLEARGYDRRKRAFGTGGGRLSGALAGGHRAAKRMPWAVVAVAVLLTLGGAYGAAQIDTTFDQEDFIADDPADWAKSLPGPFAAGDYSVKENMGYVNEHFLRQDTQAQLLVEGDITDDRTLERTDELQASAAETDVAVVLPNGEAHVRSPLTAMESVAAENESFAATYDAADTTGDDVPDQNLEAVYDEFFEVAPEQARDVIHRTGGAGADGGEYQSLRVVVSTQGDAAPSDVNDQLTNVASTADGDGLQVTATGQIIVFHLIEQELFETVIQSMLVALVAVVAFLMVAYRWTHGSALLGLLTIAPIVFGVAWILGTMYLLGVPFNVMTGTITSLTIGLGVAYNIHMTERYLLEYERGDDPFDALYRSVTGTGGALFGSAATTVGGFGVLIFAILPPLQQFGLITGLTIIYAFLGSVFVLPSMLVLWTNYVGDDAVTVAAVPSTDDSNADAGGDGE
ncbi:efflux RND transporter permease subunit [Natronorubrum sp. DTA7]|uniref:efflux RND transporter permease subunit n=1 Tax=Natronorubrum sp. DTA7 TaxID=3447016 RepID=UPI003F850941